MITITSDYSEVYAELDRLEAMPTSKTVVALDAALESSLEITRARVHVDTGALKASGDAEAKVLPGVWEGSFSFGDSVAGVDYAIYELARGGDHDFFSKVFLLKKLFVEAIKTGLRKT